MVIASESLPVTRLTFEAVCEMNVEIGGVTSTNAYPTETPVTKKSNSYSPS